MAECETVCEHLHLPVQAGSDRTLARMRRGYTAERYLQRLEARARRYPTLPSRPTSSSASPARPTPTSTARSRSSRPRATTPLIRSCSRRGPGPPAADMTDEFVAPDVAQARLERLVDAVERHGLARHEARVGRIEEVLRRRPVEEGPDTLVRAHPSEQARPLPRPHPPAASTAPTPGPRRVEAAVRVTGAAPHWLRGELVDVTAPARRARRTHPGRRRLIAEASIPCRRRSRISRSSALPRRGSPSWPSVWRAPSVTSRSSRSTRCRSTAGSTSAPRSRRPRSGRPSRTTCRRRRAVETWSVARFQTEAAGRGRRHRGAAASAALLVGGTGLYVQAVVDDLTFPGEDLDLRAELEAATAEPGGVAAAYAELAERRPGRGGAASTRTTSGASCGRSR